MLIQRGLDKILTIGNDGLRVLAQSIALLGLLLEDGTMFLLETGDSLLLE